ncbi:enoyl-CoA hydratase/isomerase family protein [Rhodococcoides fascians]|uniref:enoyl-CoA hydratase/isomerase family protein n=1 Tax=Rhodococcoides fascians TaxID=1828 RepID=UPI00050CD54C|nr:enoyl-CoA hydratase/isomerase family protein [Rhodococcus fascians]
MANYQRFEALSVEADGPIRIVTMNRPDTLNAADAVMHRELGEIWSELRDDEECRVVILTGAGRAFSAGGDLPRMVATQEDQQTQDEVFDEARRSVLGMIALPQPLIAAVNGAAVGLGASLVALCDTAIASEKAFVADPHLGVGLVPADGAALLWPLMMGVMRAKHYVFTGARIPAQRAYELGLFSEVVPHDQVLDTALKLAKNLAAHPPRALQDTKRLMNQYANSALLAVLEDAMTAERRSVNSAEHAALTRQFINASQVRAAAKAL